MGPVGFGELVGAEIAPALGPDAFGVSNVRPGPMGIMDRAMDAFGGQQGDNPAMDYAKRMFEMQEQQRQDAAQAQQMAAPMGGEMGPTGMAAAQSNIAQAAGNVPAPSYQAPATAGAFGPQMGMDMGMAPMLDTMDPILLQQLLGQGGY